jgi:hypothetical protein
MSLRLNVGLALLTVAVAAGCCTLPVVGTRVFTARFDVEPGGTLSPIFQIRAGGTVEVLSTWTANSETPVACTVHFQCPQCGAFPLIEGEVVVAPRTTNVMLSASGKAPAECRVSVVEGYR